MEFSKSRSFGVKKSDKLQVLSGEQESEGGLMFPDEDDTSNWSAPDEIAGSEAGEELAGYQQKQAGSEVAAVEMRLSDSENFDEERDDAWLAAVRYSPNGTEVCFEMANKGICHRVKKFGKCKYSHDPEDIRMFKAAKTLGKDGIQRIAGTLHPRKTYDKTHSESTPKFSSHGARATSKHSQGASGSECRS